MNRRERINEQIRLRRAAAEVLKVIIENLSKVNDSVQKANKEFEKFKRPPLR